MQQRLKCGFLFKERAASEVHRSTLIDCRVVYSSIGCKFSPRCGSAKIAEVWQHADARQFVATGGADELSEATRETDEHSERSAIPGDVPEERIFSADFS